jgi:hypothetical protein
LIFINSNAGGPWLRALEVLKLRPSLMEKTVTRSFLIPFALACVLAACSNNDLAAQGGSAQAAMGAPPAAGAQPGAGQNTGKVLQVQDGGGYTYAEVQTGGGQKVWIAGSHIEVKPGGTVEWGDFAVMRNFTAKSLGRTFPEILFVSRWGPAGAASVATPVHGSLPQPGAANAAGATDSGVVKSVLTGGGYSYIEVDRAGKVVWVAATQTPMKAGDKVQWQGGTEMSNFTAKSAGRTFEKIIFASGINVLK